MQPDRRGTRRKYMMFYTRVFDAVTGTALGHLVDITPEGAMLISEHPLPADTAYRLRIELSSEEADKPFLEFDSRCLWCRPDVNPRFYNAGFQLLNLPAEDIAIIERIVEAYGFRDN